MATNLVVPILGEAINEATVIRWNKGIGEPVKRGEELVELETDKAVLSLECPANGQVLKILAEAGTLVRPGDVLAEVGRPGEVAGAPAAQADTVSAAVPAQVDSVTAAAPSQARQQRISPAAKQMAKALGIDPSAVIPSRPGARITTEDVERFAAEAAQTAPIQALPATLPTPAPVSAARGETEIPFHSQQLTNPQKLVAERMTYSARQIPQFSVSMDVEVGKLLTLKEELAREVLKVSLTTFLVKLTSQALETHPLLNARYNDGEVMVFEQINIAVAVASSGGLVAPVIHQANQRSLGDIDVELKALAQASRSGQLSLEQITGATFTLSNLGMFGVREFIPLVNPPQAAILGVGATRLVSLPLPNWGLRAATLMTLTVSADHRVVDGEAVARFLTTLRDLIENPKFVS